MSSHAIQTDRLDLRTFAESDIPELVPLIGAREVAVTTLRIPHPYEERHAKEFLASAIEENELRLVIRLRRDGRLCGGIGLHPDDQHQRAELGYWIGVPFWGNGYAIEAARAVVRYGFEHLNFNRIFAAHFAGNDASARVLQKIGMQYEGRMRQAIRKWHKFIDLERYAILREDYLSTEE
ncbi:MAG: GNAT family N-acetyltransferase [Acidobacteria bacterium]|nr:MAG: GNAT family N-acetyltransferase [Acidobacteriota bacterium]PYV70173.1 MAG: GNAT family N-acetyltransferase [Acidobacteriota bacterium]